VSEAKLSGYTHWIAILGAPAGDDGSMSAPLLRRASRALELWRKTPDALLMCLGAAVANRHAESVVMREWLLAQGVPNDALWAETVTTTTREQARLLSRLCRDHAPQRLCVVSDRSHLPRTGFMLRRAGLGRTALCLVGARLPEGKRTLALQILHELSAWPADLAVMGFRPRG